MSDFDYWRKQSRVPLFPEVDTWQPEQKRFAGKLLIIGGSKGAFFASAKAMEVATKMGVGEVCVLLPDSLKGSVPATFEIYFAEAEPSGAFGKKSLISMLEHLAWAEAVLIVGDLGKNAETSVVFADFMKRCDKPVWMMRDAIDVLTSDSMNWSMRDEQTVIFASVAQLQKLLRAMYYPKVVTLSMPMNQLVELLHKFTLSFQMTVMTFHEGQLILAQNGNIIGQALEDTQYTTMSIWDGALMARAATLALWNREIEVYRVMARAMLED